MLAHSPWFEDCEAMKATQATFNGSIFGAYGRKESLWRSSVPPGREDRNRLHGRLDYLRSSKCKSNRLEEKGFAIHW
jgi:hypothetical protein